MNNMECKKDIINEYKTNLNKYPSLTVRTSGSTSKPLLICLNRNDIEAITNIGCRCLKFAGVVTGMTVINTLNSSMWCGGTIDSLSIMKADANLCNFSIGNTKELVELIVNLKQSGVGSLALSCTPSYLNRIELVAKKEFGLNPDQLDIDLILAGGESGVQNKNFRFEIEKRWNTRLIDANYGQADSVSMFAAENYLYQDGLTF